MATAAAKDGFRPLHEAHAIEQLIATVQFEQPLNDAAIKSVNEVMVRFQESLPGKNEIRGMGFQFGPQGVIPIAQPVNDVPNGIVRTLTDNKGVVVKELRIDRQTLVFRTLTYTRWDTVWAEVRGYLEQLLPVLGNVNIVGYSLAYLDKFIWTGASDACRPDRLLRRDSRYVSPASFDATDLWHCHSGRFINTGSPVKRLEVIEIDCVDEQDNSGLTPQTVRVARISTTLSDYLNQPGFQAIQLRTDDALTYLDSAFVALHNSSKGIFGAIVNDEAATQVGLNANAG